MSDSASSLVELAKPAIDIGFYTNLLEPTLSFWQKTLDVPFAEALRTSRESTQHRHAIGATVLKVNHATIETPTAPEAGYRGVSLARDVANATYHKTPDGIPVTEIPIGTDGIQQIGVDVVVSNLEQHRRYWGDVLGFPELETGRFAIGESQIRLEEGTTNKDPEHRAVGFRYLTVQVFDVKRVHADVLSKGGTEGMAPIKLGDVAHISFVRDPDGNWLELSQRKSITGTLD